MIGRRRRMEPIVSAKARSQKGWFFKTPRHSLQIVVLTAQPVRSLPDTLELAAVVGRERRSDKLKEQNLAAHNASRGDLFQIGNVRQKTSGMKMTTAERKA